MRLTNTQSAAVESCLLLHLLLLASVVSIGGCVRPQQQELPPEEQQASDSLPPASTLLEGGSKDGADDQALIPVKLATEHLPNAIRIHGKVISGGLPADEAAFAELSKLGIRTVISVDGAKPDVALAQRHQMRYVHLPHGYDGISDQRIKELAKAVRELEGPIYIHCHHGKHRSPAAAGAACVVAGLLPPSQSLAILHLAGTNPGYRGLFQSVERAQPLEGQLLDELQVEFRESVEVPPMAEAMVELEEVFDRLKRIEAAGWSTLQDHPDLDPAHEALLLREHFAELLRTEEVSEYAEGFTQLLLESERAAESLQAALAIKAQASRTNLTDTLDPTALTESIQVPWKTIVVGCKQCHEAYRDVPIAERVPRQ